MLMQNYKDSQYKREKVGSPEPLKIKSPFKTPSSILPFIYKAVSNFLSGPKTSSAAKLANNLNKMLE